MEIIYKIALVYIILDIFASLFVIIKYGKDLRKLMRDDDEMFR